MRVILLARDKKKNYSYDDPSTKTEADEDGPKVDRKESAKKKKGKKWLAEWYIICKNSSSWTSSSMTSSLLTKSRTEGHRKLKIDRKKAHDTGHPWPH